MGRESVGWDDLLPGYADELAHGAVALYAQRLVVLAGIRTTAAATGAPTAGRIGIDGDDLAHAQLGRHVGTDLCYRGTDFVPGNDGTKGQLVATAIGVEVGTAEPDILDAQQHLVGSGRGLRQFDDVELVDVGYL